MTSPASTVVAPVLANLAEDIRHLLAGLSELESRGQKLPLPPLRETEWFAALERKLKPQLDRPLSLIVAVVGGTNIGKSVVFNHLAGEKISASSPLASGTKHPTCVVSPRFGDLEQLAPLFADFHLLPADDPSAPLGNESEDLLFCRTLDSLPDNLLLLDTPDVDSDAPVNWRRADAVRHAADVLVAVLTMQKYNDAAVKRFFRAAAAEDKTVVLVFNLVQLPEDDDVWPRWCETFTRETGVVPLAVFLAPHDRRAAESLTLPFVERAWPADNRSSEPNGAATCVADAIPLRDVFSRLRFEELKLRTLLGAVARVVAPHDGITPFLMEVEARSRKYEEAVQLLSSESLLRDSNWPLPPSKLFVNEVRQWWGTQRQGVSRWVHEGYGWLGQKLIQPLNWLTGGTDSSTDSWGQYRESERAHVISVVERILEQLERLAALGNDVLRPRLELVLSGESRSRLLTSLDDSLRSHDPGKTLAELTAEQLALWQRDQPGVYGLLKQIDSAAAFARPALTVSLAVAGAGPVGGAMLGALPDLLAQSLVVHVAGETIATAGTVVAGETTLSVAARGMRQLELWFAQLQAAFLQRRSGLLALELDRYLLHGLMDDLRQHAELGRSNLMQDLAERATRLAKIAEKPT